MSQISQKIFCFNPSKDKNNNVNKETVYHYTSSYGLMEILKNNCFRFTDCQFLNDKSEYTHILSPLKDAIKELRGNLRNEKILDILELEIKKVEKSNDYYNHDEIINETPGKGIKGIRIFNTRYYVFCTSTQKDALNMWNYYVKEGNYQGYNIGISIDGLINEFNKEKNKMIRMFYGPVIYKERDKVNELKIAISNTDKKLNSNLSNSTDYDVIKSNEEEIIGELLIYIENCRLFFKNNYFSTEKEYRFVLRLPESFTKNEDKSLSIGYDSRRGIITPYCDVSFSKTGVIKNINTSPMIEIDLAREGINRFLKYNHYDNKIKIRPSQISIRF